MLASKITKAVIAVFFMAGVCASSAAWGQPGPQYQAWIAGVPLTCANWQGIPVQIIANPYLNNVGVAHAGNVGQPVIQLNPQVMNQFSPFVQVWWFAHECGHHALHPSVNSESNADCWGIRVMRNQGLIQWPAQLNAFANELASLPGSPAGHLPGPVRAMNIANCALS